jgi:hypothetical protein
MRLCAFERLAWHGPLMWHELTSHTGIHPAAAGLAVKLAVFDVELQIARTQRRQPVLGMVRPEGLEPPAYRFEACRSIQLSYGRIFNTSGPSAGRRDGTTTGDEAVPSRRMMAMRSSYVQPLKGRK